MVIYNLTQHTATPEQVDVGVMDLNPDQRRDLIQFLTFDTLPSFGDMAIKADFIARLAQRCGAEYAMIGGAPFFMAPLECALRRHNIIPCYAFSRRESVEQVQPDGTVKKTAIFRHSGFIYV